MRPSSFWKLLFTTLLASLSLASAAQYDPQATIKAQREALEALRFLDGTWRGPAWTLTPNGQKRHLTQTERIGSFLGGAVKVIEGRGYQEDGTVAFNALGIVSFDAAKKAYTMRTYAMGHSGDFPLTALPDGFSWELPAGPGAVIKYVATVKDGTWTQYGERLVAGQPPLRILEMNLKRIGDTSWPAGEAVLPK